MKLKSIGIGLLIVVILFVIIGVLNNFVFNKENVEVPLIVPDTIYQEIKTKNLMLFSRTILYFFKLFLNKRIIIGKRQKGIQSIYFIILRSFLCLEQK